MLNIRKIEEGFESALAEAEAERADISSMIKMQ